MSLTKKNIIIGTAQFGEKYSVSSNRGVNSAEANKIIKSFDGHDIEDVETFTRQKKQEIKNCMEECNRLKDELSDLKKLCTLGGECVWNRKWLGSHGTKTCGKCGRTEIEMFKGGSRRRKSKKRKTKRRKN